MAKNRDIMLLRVTLNCTSENRILRLYGFTQNPFPEFISLCQRNYKPGEWVTFQVQFPAGDAL